MSTIEIQKNSSQPLFVEIIPTERQTIKKWYDLEDLATYEYAHDEVKAMGVESPK